MKNCDLILLVKARDYIDKLIAAKKDLENERAKDNPEPDKMVYLSSQIRGLNWEVYEACRGVLEMQMQSAVRTV